MELACGGGVPRSRAGMHVRLTSEPYRPSRPGSKHRRQDKRRVDSLVLHHRRRQSRRETVRVAFTGLGRKAKRQPRLGRRKGNEQQNSQTNHVSPCNTPGSSVSLTLPHRRANDIKAASPTTAATRDRQAVTLILPKEGPVIVGCVSVALGAESRRTRLDAELP